jgi:hypothetical protein
MGNVPRRDGQGRNCPDHQSAFWPRKGDGVGIRTVLSVPGALEDEETAFSSGARLFHSEEENKRERT